ncbi:hypothetical protein H8959_001742 [Pygathrix nigripes]
MPRVVPDQRSKFENEEFFRKLSRECEIKYTGFRDRPHEERQARFQNACRDGRSEIAFVATGTNLSLQFFPASWQGEQRQTPSREYVDLEREAGKDKKHFKAKTPAALFHATLHWYFEVMIGCTDFAIPVNDFKDKGTNQILKLAIGRTSSD